ncbi:MAG: AhpC/TSA family protein [Bacteroidales bacterium]|nr:AhpC/TSA family protein [Bacteroidales bacterium]
MFLPIVLFAEESKPYVIEGKIGQYNDPAKIFLVYRTLNERIIEDSTVMKNGYFRFEGKTEYPFLVHLYLAKEGDRNKVTQEDALSFYLEAGEIHVNSLAELGNASVQGSKTDNLNQDFHRSLSSIQERADHIQQTFRNATAEQQNNQVFIDSLDLEFEKVQSDYNNAGLTFILNHRDEILSVYMLQSQLNTYPNDPNVEPVFNSLSERVRQSPPGKKLETSIRAYKTLNEGTLAPDFTANDTKGNSVSLSDFRGKFVFLVFWSPTCNHCLGEVPQLQKTYKLYKDKGLEIISFALEKKDGTAEWIQVVNENKMNWINISDLKEWESEVLKEYKVHGVPKNYLIDPEGIIISKELYGNALYKKMKELFNN